MEIGCVCVCACKCAILAFGLYNYKAITFRLEMIHINLSPPSFPNFGRCLPHFFYLSLSLSFPAYRAIFVLYNYNQIYKLSVKRWIICACVCMFKHRASFSWTFPLREKKNIVRSCVVYIILSKNESRITYIQYFYSLHVSVTLCFLISVCPPKKSFVQSCSSYQLRA